MKAPLSASEGTAKSWFAQNRDRAPNFFFIGAMRAGSTSIHHMLGQHPEVFMTKAKEPCFFIAEDRREQMRLCSHPIEREKLEMELSDYVSRGHNRILESYAGLFDDAEGFRIRGESSHYLYRPNTARLIRDCSPDARILISLRDPVDRLYSEYQLRCRAGKISCSFHDHVFRGLKFDSEGHLLEFDPRSRLGKGFYARLVKPWIDAFGRERIHVVLFDDFQSDPAGAMRAIFRWLDLDATFEVSHLHAQRSGVPLSPWIHKLVAAGGSIPRRWLKPWLPAGARIRLKDLLYRKAYTRKPLDPDSRAKLIEIYRDDVLWLEQAFQLDLAHWRKTGG